MDYKVIISEFAKQQIDEYLYYLAYVKKNEQAVRSVWEDFQKTSVRLGIVAGSIKDSDNDILKRLRYKIIHLEKHKYIMVFRVIGRTAFVEAVYHESQDYINLLGAKRNAE
jgi:plasmid stabilization system protein ParE